MKKMRVCVVTGTRAEFGIWRPVLEAIRRSKRLQLQLLVTGMHLLPGFGKTVRDIEESAYRIDARVPMYRGGEEPEKSLARGIAGMGKAFRELKPGLVMVLGDRLEMLAAASAALAVRIPIAHVHGGETAPGIWDEQIRHAITKMAQVHFCATEKAGERIRQMGEEPKHVHVVGAPALDLIEAYWKRVKFVADLRMPEMATVVLHPSGGSDAEEWDRAHEMLGAMMNAHVLPYYVIGPNNDPGHQGILRALRESGHGIHMSVPQEEFWKMLSQTGVLIGNSSSGIIEAASLGIPVVNIGDRQAGRERNKNVIDVGWDQAEIHKALRRATGDQAFRHAAEGRRNLYGDGRASQRIVKVLEVLAADKLESGVVFGKRFFDR